MDIKERVKKVVVQLFKVKNEEIKDNVSLQDSIGVDSTEMVELVIALEKEFNKKLSPKEITKTTAVNAIVEIIGSK